MIILTGRDRRSTEDHEDVRLLGGEWRMVAQGGHAFAV